MQSGVARRGAFILIAALLFLFAGVAGASAAEFTVDSTGDQPDVAIGLNGCETAAGVCTLRAAIEESNVAISAEGNKIRFQPHTFDGKIGSTIELGSPLPTVTEPVGINGSPNTEPCETEYLGISGPCAGIDGPAGGTAFRVSAVGVALANFAISGAKTAVEAVGGPGLTMRNDWLGLKLDGSAGQVETALFLDQDSNGARIGGFYSEGRDVFANDTGAGINIDGADGTEVLGDFFGVAPDGATPARNGTDIEIGDAEAGQDRVARHNEIGWATEVEPPSGSACDNGCNVISGAAGAGIDLTGKGAHEEPATGSTRIKNNYIGLNAFGTATVPNLQEGIALGAAESVTVGGPSPVDRNHIAGGAMGVLGGFGATNIVIEGNWVGLDPAGTRTLDPPTTAGIALEKDFGSVTVSENRISMLTGNAIESAASPSVIRRNVIGEGVDGGKLPGGATGILLPGTCAGCALVYDNSIANSSDVGVWIEGNLIHLYGNRIEESGDAGVYVERPGLFGGVLGTLVGGDTTAEENVISESGGPAIEIVAAQQYNSSLANVIARNRGSSNAGPFIVLVGGAEEGIQPPRFSTTTETGASGQGAEPGDVIRVFRKADASPGEIEGFLAETSADKDGDWSVVFPSPVPAGTVVTATQSREQGGLIEYGEGTSELAIATTTAPPSGVSGGGEGGDGASATTPGRGAEPALPPSISRPPRTSILSRPPARLRSTVARFRFLSDDATAEFRCQLDDGRVVDCGSSKIYKGLRPGKHVFKVWAVWSAANRTRRRLAGRSGSSAGASHLSGVATGAQ